MASSSTMRFPESLKAEATAYGATLGLSLNGLCAVALREYLDLRKGRAVEATPKAVAEPPSPAPLLRGASTPPRPVEGQSVDLGELLRQAVPAAKRNSKKRHRR